MKKMSSEIVCFPGVPGDFKSRKRPLLIPCIREDQPLVMSLTAMRAQNLNKLLMTSPFQLMEVYWFPFSSWCYCGLECFKEGRGHDKVNLLPHIAEQI